MTRYTLRKTRLVLGLACLLPCVAMAAPSDEQVQALEARLAQQDAVIARLEQRLQELETSSRTAAIASAPTTVEVEAVHTLDRRVAMLESAKPTVNWASGAPEFASSDGRTTFRLRARMFLETASTSGSSHSDRNLTGSELRDLVIGADGKFGNGFSYFYELSGTDNKLAVKNAFVAWTGKIGGQATELSFGNRVSERGFDLTTSLNEIRFMERNTIASVTTPFKGAYGMGARARLLGDNWHVAVEASGNDVNGSGTSSDTLTYSARTHWSPTLAEGTYLHFGAWAFTEELTGAPITASRNVYIGGHFNDSLQVMSGQITGQTHGDGYGLELGMFGRRGWLLAEDGRRVVKGSASGSDVYLDAYSIQGGWMLSGERPAYSTRLGSFVQQKVDRPVSGGKGWGAWELNARYEAADMRDAPLGGYGSAWTLGVTWWLNPNLRLMSNLVHWKLDNAAGALQGRDEGKTIGVSARLTY